MENCYVKATFWKENGTIYRNKTKIIFNKINEKEETLSCIGIVLMLNPGSCLPKEGEDVIKEGIPLTYLCEIDNTQRKVAICINEAYKDCHTLEGYVYIVNISEKREPNSKEFYKNFHEEDYKNREREILEEVKMEIEKQENQIKWIWVAFGKDKKTAKLREKILNQLKTTPLIKSILVGIDEMVNCMHPSSPWFYRNKNGQTPKEIIINEIESKLQNS